MTYKRIVPTHPCLNCPHKQIEDDYFCERCGKCNKVAKVYPVYLTVSHDLCPGCDEAFEKYIYEHDAKFVKKESSNDCKECSQLFLDIDQRVCPQCIRILEPYIDQTMIKCSKHKKE